MYTATRAYDKKKKDISFEAPSENLLATLGHY